MNSTNHNSNYKELEQRVGLQLTFSMRYYYHWTTHSVGKSSPTDTVQAGTFQSSVEFDLKEFVSQMTGALHWAAALSNHYTAIIEQLGVMHTQRTVRQKRDICFHNHFFSVVKLNNQKVDKQHGSQPICPSFNIYFCIQSFHLLWKSFPKRIHGQQIALNAHC